MVVLDATIVNVALPRSRSTTTARGACRGCSTPTRWSTAACCCSSGASPIASGRRGFPGRDGDLRWPSLPAGLAVRGNAARRPGRAGGGALVSPTSLWLMLTALRRRARAPPRAAHMGRDRRRGGARAARGRPDRRGLSWRWVFFVNVPIGAAVLALAPRIVPESRSERGTGRIRRRGRGGDHARHDRARLHADQGRQLGLDLGADAGGFAVAAVLIAAFLWSSSGDSTDPLVPLRIFSNRSLAAADATMLVVAAALFGVFFFLHALSATGAGLQRAQDQSRLPAAEPDSRSVPRGWPRASSTASPPSRCSAPDC